MITTVCLTLLSTVGGSQTFSMAGASIASRTELNAAVDTGTNKKMGFLSMANYHSVHTMLSQSVQPIVYTSTQQLYDAVSNGTVIGGMISGIPNRSIFTVFSTNLVSPRSFQMMPGSKSRHLMEAVDAAVVRTHNDGAIATVEKANPPFEAVEIHTCKSDDLSKVPFPSASAATGLLKNVLDTKKLRILSYGLPDKKPDWLHDGNYKVTPHTGFWPDYMSAFMVKFREAYGQDIQLERVWMKAGGTDSVLNGSIHMTEPYYIYENLYNNRVKKWSHDFSCVVLGYEQRFFTKKSLVVTDAGSAPTCSQQLASCVSTKQGAHINSRFQLNQMLDSGTNKKMGFLSMANYNSVHTMLSKLVKPVIYTSSQELEDAVYNGTLIAGKMSGVPTVSKFSAFSTDLLSPRAFQMAPGPDSRHLMEAVDAAVVRTHNDGAIGTAEKANPPFQAVEIHTCKSDDVSKVPFPNASSATGLLKNVLDAKKLRMLAYGLPDNKPDWMQDGNYKVSPATGFWPDYVRAFMVKFREAYGQDIQLERVWMKSGGTLSVLNGSIHMTEPYYIYENLYNNRVKKWSHDFSCVVMGYEQNFFSKKPDLSFAGATCALQLAACEGHGKNPTTDIALENTLTGFTTVFVLLMTIAWAS